MKNLTFLKIVFILISASFISSCAETEMTYDVFLEKHLTASGGAAAISNVQNIDIDLIITEGDNAMNAHYRANRDGQMRIDVFIGGERVFTEALSSANDGWQLDGGETEAKPLSADGKLALQKGIHFNLYGLHEMPDLGYKIDFLGSQNLNDVDYWAVDITSPEGKIERRFFDKKTFLKSVTIDESALHVDVDPTKSLNASYSYDYQDHDGVMFSRSGEVIDINKQQVIQGTEIKSISINSDLDPEQFLGPNL